MPTIRLDLGDPQQHLLAISIELEAPGPHLVLNLPAWTPGSYLIRDYVRHLEGLEVQCGGKPCQLRRLGPASWQVDLAGTVGEPVQIGYRLLATDLSVRTCHLDADHGFFALAAVVLEVEGQRWSPHRLEIVHPPDWHAFVPLPEAGPGAWLARDFDQLVDSPLELGPHRCASFAVAGVPHRWVTWEGAGSSAWLERHCPTLIRDVQATAEACCRLMGVTVPASANYLFVLHLLDEGYGGLEHDDSCVLVYGRASLKTPAGYRKFLQLVAHEYLHQWNVRRLRPAELTPIDYHQAVVVPSLWFAEGITSYCDQFLPLTAGLGSEPELLEDLGQDLSRYLLTPGRQVQSLEASSQEAWVKLYRADAYAGDNQVSYYLKGAVIALVLDLHLRRQGSALSKVLRTLWQDFGRRGRGYQQGDLVAAFAAEAPDLDTLLPRWLQDHGDPDLAGYLADVGLQLVPQTAKTAWLGLATKAEPAGLVLQRVHRHGPAEAAGLAVGDELIAVAGERVRQPEALKAAWSPGQTLEVLFCRRGRVRLTGLTAAPAAVESWRLEPDPDAPAQALERRRQWLSLQPA